MGFIRQFLRRNKQQATPPTPAQRSIMDVPSIGMWLNGVGGGINYRTGDIIATEQGYAHAYTAVIAVNRSVELIVNAIDSLDWQIVRMVNDEPVRIAGRNDTYPAHPLARAIQSHTWDYGRSYLRLLVYATLLYDEHYTELIRNRYGITTGVRWLNPLGMTPNIVGDEITSFTYGFQGQSQTFKPDDIAYAFGFDPFNDLRGQSNILTALSAINIDRNLKRFVQGFFVNGALPGAIISPVQEDGITTAFSQRDIDELRLQFQDYVKGVQNAFRTIIPKKPVDVTTFEPPDITSNYATSTDIGREVYQAFGIPLELAGGTETRFKFGDDVYNAFMALTIRPQVERLQEFINVNLLPAFSRYDGQLQFQFDDSPFNVFTEHDERVANNARANLQATVISLNEARRAQGMSDDPVLEGFYVVSGVPVPVNELPNLWRYQFGVIEDAIDAAQVVANDGQPTPPSDDEPPDDEPPTPTVPDDGQDGEPTRAGPDKYDHIDFKPTESMQTEAQRGLEWRREYGRGGTEVGIARARDISNRTNLSPDTVRRMKAFFDRHQQNEQAEGWSPGEDGYPSNGRIAHSLWGGDAGYSWARARVERMNAADENTKGVVSKPLEFEGFKTNYPEFEIIENAHHEHGPDCGCMSVTVDERTTQELAVWRRLSLKEGAPHKTWQKQFVSDVLDATLMQFIREQLDDTGGDRDMIADVFRWADLESQRYTVSDHAKTAASYRAGLGRLGRALWAGRIGDFEWIAGMETLINREYRLAFEAGALTMGIAKNELTDAERAIYQDLANEELRLAMGLLEWIQENSKANGGKAAAVTERVQAWAARYDRLYSAGQLAGARDKKLEWNYGNTEHCRDCLRLNGRVYRASTWLRYGIMPRSPELECFGVYCGCSFAETDAPITKGRPPRLIGPR